MKALTFTGGTHNVPTFDAGNENLRDIMLEIASINSPVVKNTNSINAVLAPMEATVPRKEGTLLPVKIHNIKFTKGGFNTDAKVFRPYLDAFKMEKAEGYNAKTYNFTADDLLQAENDERNIDAEILTDVKAIRDHYIDKYLPNVRLKTLITGCSSVDTIPEKDDAGNPTKGIDGYKRCFGFARGEDYADFLYAGETNTVRDHYLTIKGTTFSSDDIFRAIDLIEGTIEYSRRGILALAHPRTVQQLAALAQAPENKDIPIFGKITSAFGADWKGIEAFPKDLIIYLDKGYLDGTKPLIINGVEVSENQRGLGLVYENNLDLFKTMTDFKNAKFRIFPEERYMVNRLAGVVQTINPNHVETPNTGFMGNTAVTAINTWIAQLDAQVVYK